MFWKYSLGRGNDWEDTCEGKDRDSGTSRTGDQGSGILTDVVPDELKCGGGEGDSDTSDQENMCYTGISDSRDSISAVVEEFFQEIQK